MHSFDTSVAILVGVNSAAIYQNVIFWTAKNMANERHIHDEYVWTYNSVRAMEGLFPYLSSSQIKTAVAKLVDAGLVKEGNFNKSTYDRTKWIGVSCQIHLPEIANGLAKNRQPIPDSKPDNKPDSNLCVAEQPTHNDFNEFWKSHPRPRAQDETREIFTDAVASGVSADWIISSAKFYAADNAGNKKQYIAYSDTWLSGSKWTEFPQQKTSTNDEKLQYYAGMVNGEKPLFNTITPSLARELVSSGLVTPDRMKERT